MGYIKMKDANTGEEYVVHGSQLPGPAAPDGSVKPKRTDSERIEWMQRTKTGVNYNVECCAWGVDYESPYQQTLREAIDAAMDLEIPRNEKGEP